MTIRFLIILLFAGALNALSGCDDGTYQQRVQERYDELLYGPEEENGDY